MCLIYTVHVCVCVCVSLCVCACVYMCVSLCVCYLRVLQVSSPGAPGREAEHPLLELHQLAAQGVLLPQAPGYLGLGLISRQVGLGDPKLAVTPNDSP